MAVTLNANLDLAPFRDLLAAYRSKAGDLTPLMSQIGMLLETSTRDRIQDTNVAPDGAAWPKSFRAEQDGGKTLHDSGRLAASIVNEPGPNKVLVGSNVIYAGIHQTGGDIVPKNGDALAFGLPDGGYAVVGKVTIPARPYLGISEQDRGDILAATVTYFDGEAAP